MSKIYYPKLKATEYTANGVSCFIQQDGIHYLKRPIERKFYNGMTWDNYGTVWTITGPTTPTLTQPRPDVTILNTKGKPILI
jgi:hypothetical protein